MFLSVSAANGLNAHQPAVSLSRSLFSRPLASLVLLAGVVGGCLGRLLPGGTWIYETRGPMFGSRQPAPPNSSARTRCLWHTAGALRAPMVRGVAMSVVQRLHAGGSNLVTNATHLSTLLFSLSSAYWACHDSVPTAQQPATSPPTAAVLFLLVSGALQLSSYERKVPGGRYPKNYF